MIKYIKKKFKQTYRTLDILFESLFRFMFGQFAFTLLPISVIALIRFVIGKTNETTTFLGDVAFSTVVFSGLVLIQTLELKKLQGDINSFRVKLLLQFFILNLIMTVATLSMVVINNNGVILNITPLKGVQFFLFWHSVFWLFFVYHTKIRYEKRKTILDETTSTKEYYKYLGQSIENVKDQLLYILFACERKNNIEQKIENELYDSSEHYMNEMESSFDSKISEIENILNKIKQKRKI
jgi:hypothetical protein